jgi:hypothetical protein
MGKSEAQGMQGAKLAGGKSFIKHDQTTKHGQTTLQNCKWSKSFDSFLFALLLNGVILRVLSRSVHLDYAR